jgi:hypothetical protein
LQEAVPDETFPIGPTKITRPNGTPSSPLQLFQRFKRGR